MWNIDEMGSVACQAVGSRIKLGAGRSRPTRFAWASLRTITVTIKSISFSLFSGISCLKTKTDAIIKILSGFFCGTWKTDEW